MAKVSVAMIAYNKASVIEQAIRGVVGQRAPFEIELVIVNDASTDATLEIARRWEARYPEMIHVYDNETNLGLQRNYLKAFSLCRGEYLAVCDADDYWISPSKLRRQVEYMDAHPDCALTFHRVVNLYEEDGSMSLSNGGQKVDTTLADLARSNYITNLSVVYRREALPLDKIPAWVADDPSPDYAFHLLAAASGNIHYFRRPMGAYRISAGSAWSMTERRRRLEMSLSVRQRFMEYYADRPEVAEGLRWAAKKIISAMDTVPAPPRARVLTALRRHLSRLLQWPGPCRL
ncbi:MAG: glycosyltransferase [Pseudoflavonifractor sp.]|nr:glycosyltransferase [Alloprevotella sp.]MCM1116913.1 glycosyltransferase [Pseudoflavonifractor sp.]